MNRSDIHFPPKHEALRDDVHALGALVGEILAEQGGDSLFKLVELDRVASIGRREGNELARRELAASVRDRPPALARDLVRAFLTAASKVALVEAEYRAHIEHTDDYPSLEVEVGTKQGLLRIGTQSQQRPKSDYVDRTPWRVDYRDRTFVVTASDLDQAFAPFEHYLQDEKVFSDMWEDYNRKR